MKKRLRRAPVSESLAASLRREQMVSGLTTDDGTVMAALASPAHELAAEISERQLMCHVAGRGVLHKITVPRTV